MPAKHQERGEAWTSGLHGSEGTNPAAPDPLASRPGRQPIPVVELPTLRMQAAPRKGRGFFPGRVQGSGREDGTCADSGHMFAVWPGRVDIYASELLGPW